MKLRFSEVKIGDWAGQYKYRQQDSDLRRVGGECQEGGFIESG